MSSKGKTKFFAGAWKVAYGDFVTGMMALFLVLWITTMKTDEVFATTRYFKDSYLFGYTPADPIKQPETRIGSIVNQIIGYEESVLPNEEQPRDTIQYKVLEQMAMEFYKLLNLEEPDPDERVKIKIEQDSIRITLFDNDRFPIFIENQPGHVQHHLTGESGSDERDFYRASLLRKAFIKLPELNFDILLEQDFTKLFPGGL